jgi:fucose 4-O-acetylase-like acetyltransferase
VRVVLFFMWFTVLYWIVRRYEAQISRYSFGLVELLGRNSLLVYTIHAFIVFIFKMYLIPVNTTFLQNFMITAGAVALMVGLLYVYKNWAEPRLARLNFPGVPKPQKAGS